MPRICSRKPEISFISVVKLILMVKHAVANVIIRRNFQRDHIVAISVRFCDRVSIVHTGCANDSQNAKSVETKAMLDLHTDQTGNSAQKNCKRARLRKLRTMMTESKSLQQLQTVATVQIEAKIRRICANHSHGSHTRMGTNQQMHRYR